MSAPDLTRILLSTNLSRDTVLSVDLRTARLEWAAVRSGYGFVNAPTPLLTPPDANVKLSKSAADAVIYGLSLAPAGLSGWQVCRYRTPECEAGCVAFSGKGDLPDVIRARQAKTAFLAERPASFLRILVDEVGTRLAARLNTFSDLPWERIAPWLFNHFSDVTFYDYSKWSDRETPANYDITFSVSDRTPDAKAIEMAAGGRRVAVVFSTRRTQPLPDSWNGVPVVDGDKTDARFTDPAGVIVGLRAKGRMRRGTWVMVREV
jgi:hypothetical protein